MTDFNSPTPGSGQQKITAEDLGVNQEGSTARTTHPHPIPYRVVISPRVPPTVRRERIKAGTAAICIWCQAVEDAGTLITASHWELGVPKAHAVFICDPCFLSIMRGDQEYAALELAVDFSWSIPNHPTGTNTDAEVIR